MTPLVVMFAWVLWHDLSVYRAAELMPLAGPTYQVTSYDTNAECEAEQRAALVKEELPRVGPMTERLSRSEEPTSELQSRGHLVCRLLLEIKKRFQDTRVRSNQDGVCY